MRSNGGSGWQKKRIDESAREFTEAGVGDRKNKATQRERGKLFMTLKVRRVRQILKAHSTTVIPIVFLFVVFVGVFGLGPGDSSAKVFGGHTSAQNASADKEKREVSDAEKILKWKGENITILGTKPLWCPARSNDEPPFSFKQYDDKGKGKPQSVNKYAGQMGVIVDTRPGPLGSEIVIQLDKTGEKIVSSITMGIAFNAEMEVAKGWLGRSLWSKGAQTLAPGSNDYVCRDGISKGDRVEIKNLEKLTITRVEFGTHAQKTYFLAKTDDGREGWLDGWEGYDYIEEKFHLKSQFGVRIGPYADRFYFEDQRRVHSGWSPNIWKLIDDGTVAIGMGEDMAKLACGRSIRAIGLVIADPGGELSTIYDCSGQRFLVEKGKVTKFVDR